MESSNTDSLQQLLKDFFLFYSNYDFTTKAISLRTGSSINKPDSAPLHVCNPLETSLNVSKNVNIIQITKFINAVRTAALLLEENDDQNSRGLIDLFEEKILKIKNAHQRMHKVRIAELFEVEDNETDERRIEERVRPR